MKGIFSGGSLTRGMNRENSLDGIPCLGVNDRVAVALDGEIGEFEYPHVDLVLKKGAVGVEGVV